ncbi:polysaccharide deacetylase family protein [Nocardia thailandica]|uniref:polysaccharide deacetylase family protein n=1 Tax=Nocardia thailandica TaxID=257275 RepID=UPI0002E9FA80|nr:polysaccharide deacetylase family protein [Nocardia thailandica]
MADRSGLSRRRVLGFGGALAAGAAVTCVTGRFSEQAAATPDLPPTSPRVATPVSSVLTPPVSPAGVAAAHQNAAPRLWGTEMPGIVSSFAANGRQVALTFDACGGPGNSEVDQALLDLLVAQRIPATLFVNKRWVDADPDRTRRLGANPLFELANHGDLHKPLSVRGRAAYGIAGTGSAWEAADEVWANHQRLTELTGRAPRFFRAGTAHYDDVAVAIVTELGETPLGFTVNADSGATASAALVQAAVRAAAPGGIVLAHFHRPRSGTAAGMTAALPALRAAGYEFVHL